MIRIGVIVISYNADPRPLFTNICSSRHNIRSYVFLHGQNVALKTELEVVTASTDSRYFPYAKNRGVARSWNEGLCASFADGNDATLLVNDDLFFYEGGLDTFIDFVLSEGRRVPEFGTISVFGLDTGAAGSLGAGRFYQRPHWQGAACMAIGRHAIEAVGYFDQNFWPAYFEDADYFRRLELSGVPNLWDERVLLEHNRSQAVRADFLLKKLHGERTRRNEAYYIRKWGGLRGWGGPDAPPGLELFNHPFNDPKVGCTIPLGTIEAPYGSQYDRRDLDEAHLGVLGNCVSEELLSLLERHAGSPRRVLEWGSEHTEILAGFAQGCGTELLLAIDYRLEHLRAVVAQLPRYPFLHPRFIDAEEMSDITSASDIAFVDYPWLMGVTFDVILIAGRWRMECAAQARGLLSPNGIVVFQDWRNPRYEALLELFQVVQESHSFVVLRAPAKIRADRGSHS